MPKERVQIVLSTYNGEAFLKEQLDSILAQSYTEWQLIIRDDGSSDQTLKIIKSYQERIPEKIELYEGGSGGNASTSFMSLLSHATANYLMFCDQDDVWNKDKVERSLEALLQLEKENPKALVYTDMEVVSADLTPLFSSFIKHQKLDPSWAEDPYAVLVQSMAAGCTMIFTKDLVKNLHPIIAPLFQHDHWLLIHAAFYGKLAFLDETTMKYRQHGENAVGSHEINTRYFLLKLTELRNVWRRWRYIRKCFRPRPGLLKLFLTKIRLNSNRVA
jgi:glycosyltransferase involved in cell wall biosynthesis